MTTEHQHHARARAANKRIAAALLGRRPRAVLDFAAGTVKSLSTGADGGVLTTVTVLGADLPMQHYGTAPAAGAPVHVLFIDNAPICLGAPTGTPLTS